MVAGHLPDGRERLPVLTLFRMHLPEGDSGALERRGEAHRLREECDLRLGRLGEQPLDVLLERRQRRVRPLDLLGSHRRARHDAAGDAAVDAQQVGQRTPLDQRRRHAAGIETDGARLHDEIVALQCERAHHHGGRADDLTDADDRGVAERRHGRDAQPGKRPKPVLAPDRGRAERGEIVGEQHRGRFAQPVHPRLAGGVLERHDQVDRW
jgi:hypothetical protein